MKNGELTGLRSSLVSKAKGTVLEIGFGSGLNLPYYKNTNKLYALEPSQELFDLARGSINNTQFTIEHLKNSAEKIPLADMSVDSVVSTWCLCSVPDPEKVLKEIHRVLKLEGEFFFIEHGLSNNELKVKLQNIVNPFSRALIGGCNLNREIDTLILKSGFNINDLEKFEMKSKPLAFMYKGIARIATPEKGQDGILKTNK